MLTNNLELMQRASRGGLCHSAINTQGGNYDIIWACCKAAQEMRSPIILAHLCGHRRLFRARLVRAGGQVVRK